MFTPLLDRTAGDGPLPPRFFAATGVCLLAVVLLMSGNGFHTPSTGDLLMLAAAVVRAGHVVLVGQLTKGRAIRPLRLTTVQLLVGSALFAVPASNGLPELVRADAASWAQLLYLALFCGVFAFLAQTWAIQASSPSRASLLLGTEPVWAVTVGISLGGETLTPLAALGAVLMVTGTYWGQSIERAHRTASGWESSRPASRGAPTPSGSPTRPGSGG